MKVEYEGARREERGGDGCRKHTPKKKKKRKG